MPQISRPSILMLCLMFCLAHSACNDVPQEKVQQVQPWLVKIGLHEITKQDVQLEIQMNSSSDLRPEKGTENYQKFTSAMLNNLIRRELLLLEVDRRKIVISPDEVTQALESLYPGGDSSYQLAAESLNVSLSDLTAYTRNNLLIEKLFTHDIYPRILISKSEVETEYERTKENYKTPEMLRVRQIVLADEETAKKAMRKLWQGKKFSAIAREMSIMPEKEKGGDLGWVSRKSLPEPFSELFFKVARHTFNRPVKSNYGYHIINITGHKPEKQMDFETAKPLVQNALYNKKKVQAEEELLDFLRNQYKVAINENYQSTENKP